MSQKSNKRKNALVKVFNFMLILLFALPVGYYAGGWVTDHYFFTPSETIIFDADESAILANIDFSNKTPDQLVGSEVFFVALKTLANQDYFYSRSNGVINASITTQVIDHIIEKDGDQVRQESYSTGFVNLASRSEYTLGGNVSLFEGKTTKNNSTIAWSADKVVSPDAYKLLYGKFPDQPWAYNVYPTTFKDYPPTVLHESECQIKDELYYFTLKLDPVNSVANYKDQIKTLSNLNKHPTFSSVEITFAVDKDFRFVSFVSRETYVMSFHGVPIPVKTDDSQPYTSTFRYEKI